MTSAFAKYNNAAITTSNDAQQHVIVFDKIVQLLHQAKKAAEGKDFEAKHNSLSKVNEILNLLYAMNDAIENPAVKDVDEFYSASISKVRQLNFEDVATTEYDHLIEGVRSFRNLVADVAQKAGLL